jgi:hypothetical protein
MSAQSSLQSVANPAMTEIAQSRLILERGPIGWNQDDYDVLENGVIVAR